MVMAKRNNKYGKYTGKTKLEQRIRELVDSGMNLADALAAAKKSLLEGTLFNEIDIMDTVTRVLDNKTLDIASTIVTDHAEGQRISVQDPATGQLALTDFVNKKSPKYSSSRAPLAFPTKEIEEEGLANKPSVMRQIEGAEGTEYEGLTISFNDFLKPVTQYNLAGVRVPQEQLQANLEDAFDDLLESPEGRRQIAARQQRLTQDPTAQLMPPKLLPSGILPPVPPLLPLG